MPISAIITGAILFALGPIFYLLSESQSLTTLIPSVFGIMILACGVVASNPARTKAAMHAAVGIALLGALGSFARIVPKLGTLSSAPLSLAIIANLIMFAVTAVFVALSIGRFIKMRSAR